MRFGRTLQLAVYAPWRDNYIDYPRLKRLLRDDDSAPSSPSTETPGDKWTDQDESRFVDELVNVQLEKVHAFHKETYEKLRDRTAKCEARLDGVAVAEQGDGQAEAGAVDGAAESTETKPGDEAGSSGNGNGKQPVPSEDDKKTILTEVLSELDNITKETNELEKYSRINYTGFLKAVKKHDRKRGASYRVRPLLQVRLAALSFNTEDYSPLLYRLSAMYNFVRQHLDGVSEKRGMSISESVDGPGADSTYISHKFWVHPENLLEVKTMILRRLPVLVYNPQTSKVAEGALKDPSMTSIYFDDPAFSLYSKKVDEGEASSLRLRWFGQLADKPQIWVERKTVRADETSSDTRITTKEKYIQPFIQNEYGMEKQIAKLALRAGPDSPEVANFTSAVTAIQSLIAEHGLQPVLRANYTRTAFQIPGDDRVRISLDTDLAFIREDALDSDRPCRDPGSWHRADIDGAGLEFPFTSIRKGEIARFPFAVLEIKVRRRHGAAAAGASKTAEWIRDLMASHLVKEAPRFSKFVHGVAGLFEDYVNTFPFWLPQVETDIRRDPREAFEEEVARGEKEREEEVAVGSLLKSWGAPGAGMVRRGAQGAREIISPVGSPAMTSSGAMARGAGANGKMGQSLRDYGTTKDPSQAHDTAGEADDDETGQHAPPTTDGNGTGTGGLKTLLFPTFSTSKYAAARRHPTPLPPGIHAPTAWLKDAGPVRVEAKVWLANQRTFIKWQHVSVLLATLGVGLYNAAGVDNDVARALAVVYTLLAVAAGGWGSGVYVWRCKLIGGRSGKDFDAVAGPVGVCLGLAVALVLNFAFKYQAIVQDHNRDQGTAVLNSTAALRPHWSDL
ncbi:Phosphate metabolism transcription protein [Teratosphaeriaceae sp. CCFEE 6253]|nr:Phosphate metabolism transcription protein [Teratosphaeriaceae sp. CCFEE 6253]